MPMFQGIPAPMRMIGAGHGIMVLCCLFYLAWWSIAFRPGETVSAVSGRAGCLLLLTVGFAAAGILCNAYGIRGMQIPNDTNDVKWILMVGAVAYLLLLGVTAGLLGRKPTSELLLIVLWAVMETAVVHALYAADFLQAYTIPAVIIIGATILGLVAYLLYYEIDEQSAYYWGMVPLITDAVAMAAIMGYVMHNLADMYG